MQMSSCRSGSEGSPVAQHRPHNIDATARQGDQSLSVPLALGSLAVVKGPRLRRATQTGKSRLVEDPLEDLVAPAHPAVVTGAFAGVASRRHQPGVGGEPIGALEGAEVSHGHQKLCSEDWTHAGQASEDPSLGTGEKTLLKLLIENLDALLENERFLGEFGDDRGGDAFCRQDDVLGFGRSEGSPRELVDPFDAPLSEVGAQRRLWPVRRICCGLW